MDLDSSRRLNQAFEENDTLCKFSFNFKKFMYDDLQGVSEKQRGGKCTLIHAFKAIGKNEEPWEEFQKSRDFIIIQDYSIREWEEVKIAHFQRESWSKQNIKTWMYRITKKFLKSMEFL